MCSPASACCKFCRINTITTTRFSHPGNQPRVAQVIPIKLEDVVDLPTEPYHPQRIQQLAVQCKAQRCYESQSRQLKNECEKNFLCFARTDHPYAPLHTVFTSGRTTQKMLPTGLFFLLFSSLSCAIFFLPASFVFPQLSVSFLPPFPSCVVPFLALLPSSFLSFSSTKAIAVALVKTWTIHCLFGFLCS